MNFAGVPDLSFRSHEPELMDRPDCCETRLLRTVDQFRSINVLVGRYRTILRRWILSDMLTDPGRRRHLVDLGAGGCDIPVWLLGEARRKGLRLTVTAIDLDPRLVRHAREKHGQVEGLSIQHMDAFSLAELSPVDYVFANHFLHHLDDEMIVRLLDLVGDVVQRRFVFSDLLRHPLAYRGYSLMAKCLYHKSFALHDGCLSIQKGFTVEEAEGFLARSNVHATARVYSLLPGRLVLTG